MPVLCSNNAWGELAVPITAVGTQILLTGGQGDRFPMAVDGSSWFYATLIDAENNLEIVRVTARTADTLTVVRGVDNTTSRAYPVGTKLELRPVAALFNDKVSNDTLNTTKSEIERGYTSADTQISNTFNKAIANLRETMEDDYVTNASLEKTLSGKDDDNGTLFLSKDDAKKTYLPLTGGTVTGALRVEGAGFTVTGGDINLSSKSGVGGNLTASGSVRGDTIRATSDARVKINVTDLVGAQRAIARLRPVRFCWKKTCQGDYGFIAQEVREVIPELVSGDENKEVLSLNYQGIIPFLVAECQALRKELEELKRGK